MNRTLAAGLILGVLGLAPATSLVHDVVDPALAHAKKKKKSDEQGVELVITVVDRQTEEPIRTAKVRHPEEKDPHGVNVDTGVWRGRVLYMPDGREVFFEPGMELTFEVSAPSYVLQKITYVMRKRKNRLTIPLDRMDIQLDDVEDDDPVIQFGRDEPIGGRDIE